MHINHFRNYKSDDFNNTAELLKGRDIVNSYTNLLLYNNQNNKSFLFQTDLLSIQVSSSNEEDKSNQKNIAIGKNLSFIDYSTCVNHLKDIGLLAQNESLKISITDWDNDIKAGSLNNTNKTDNSISYSLFKSSGDKIDMNLCENKTSSIYIHLKDLNTSLYNSTDNDRLYINSTLYSDICIPMHINDTAATLDDRRNNFGSLNYTCSSGCSYQNINVTIGYISCNCNASISNIEMAPEIGTVFLTAINSINLKILECYKQFLLYVSLFT